jgi:hypothetical protein
MNERFIAQLPAHVASHLIGSSINCAVQAAKILAPLRESNLEVAEWFAQKSTRAALLAHEKLSADEREVLQNEGPEPEDPRFAPTTLCNEHEPHPEAPYQCGKCGKPLGPVPPREQATAEQIASFAIEEGMAWVAVVGVRVEADLGPAGEGLRGSLLRVDATVDKADGAPPVAHELAAQLRLMADAVEKAATARGQGTVRRTLVKPPSDGGKN